MRDAPLSKTIPDNSPPGFGGGWSTPQQKQSLTIETYGQIRDLKAQFAAGGTVVGDVYTQYKQTLGVSCRDYWGKWQRPATIGTLTVSFMRAGQNSWRITASVDPEDWAMRTRTACIIVAVMCLVSSSMVSILRARDPDDKRQPQRPAVVTAQNVTPARPADPGSPEGKRLAAQRPLVEAGVLPSFQISGPMPVPPPRPEPGYLGTSIVVRPGLKGDARRLEEEIAGAFSRLDYCPHSRRAHFAWLESNVNFKNGQARLIGWSGGILELQQLPGGSWLVNVLMRPWLYSPTMRRTLVRDHVVETYEYFGGKLRFVGTDAAIPKPDEQVFPLEL